MNCRKCGKPAVINMRHHKLALCADHFIEWVVQQTQHSIEKYEMFSRDERILVAVSGGKDSLSLWDILLELGYRADGLYIDLGIKNNDYSKTSYEKVLQFASAHPEAHLRVVDVKALYGESVPEVASRVHRGKGKPCSVCGLIKRHEMNRVTLEEGYDVLATGHNLDDEVAVLFSNTLHWQTGYLARQAPVLPEVNGLARKVKPLCRFYEREVAAYALVKGIDYIYDECPFAVGAKTIYYKTLLNRLEERSPGAKHQFYLNYVDARRRQRIRFAEDEESPPEMHPCPRCGQPTTAPGLCAFCRLWERKE